MNTRLLAFLAILLFASSCSLFKFEIEQPSQPFSQRAMSIRYWTHDFARTFNNRVISTADSMLTLTENDTDKVNILLWKIQATSACNGAAYQTIPGLALVDTWILTQQMSEYFEKDGSTLFGQTAPLAQSMASLSHLEFIRLSQTVLTEEEFAEVQEFTKAYVDSVPFTSLDFQRKSILRQWTMFFGIPDSATIETVGSLPQVVGDATDRMVVLGEQVQNTSRWQLEIFRNQLANESTETLDQIENISLAIQRLTDLIDDPTMLDSAMYVIKTEIEPMLAETQAQWNYSLMVLGQERLALTDTLRVQGNDLLVGLDSLSTNLVDHTIDRSLDALPKVMRSASLLVLVLALVLFGLPFGIGMWIGRLTRKKSNTTAA